MQARSLETVALRKVYPGTVALGDVSVKFNGGLINALIGKNGAGKSTLVKIFAGAVAPTSGRILLNGVSVELRSPREALRQGIAAVHQELSLVPELTVAENILLGRFPKRKGAARHFIDWQQIYAHARESLNRLQVDIDVKQKARNLGVAQQQLVEIAKAMSHDPSVLMLDEPTSALARHETENLFGLLRMLATQGVVILYISHRLQEIHRIADTISVLRNGMLVGTIATSDASPKRVVQMMFGEYIKSTRAPAVAASNQPVLQVHHLTRKPFFQDINLTAHAGEILGIAGLLGSGRTELLRSVFGADTPEEGDVTLRGCTVRPVSPRQMKRLGVAFTPENRKEEGLVQLLSTRANICLASLSRISRWGFLTISREEQVTRKLVLAVGITLADSGAPVSSLSGGNQQKVVVGKWLNNDPAVILLDEPTRGIDIQAKQQMFQLLWGLSKRGIGIIVVSSELEELLELCDRILIMRKGSIVAETNPSASTLEQLFALCIEQ